MFSVLIQSLVLAAGGLLSVGSITIVILLLISDRGWRNGLGYALGYVSAYMLIGVAAVWVGYSVAGNSAGEPGVVSAVLFALLGLLLLWLAQRNWRKPAPARTENPRLFAFVDRITPLKAFALGSAVTVINFKNLAIYMSAVSVVLLSGLPLPSKLMIVVLDALVFCSAVIVPVLIYLLFPNRAANVLNGIKQALESHRRPIGIGAPLIFGLIFLIRGLAGIL